MKDTHPAIEERFFKMLMEKSGGASGEYHRDAAAPENILRRPELSNGT